MEQGFGAFGKMPSMGDFFRLNTPPGFVRVWDDWVQGAMMTGAQAGGAQWDAQYMSAPIWRFTLAPSLAGAAKIMGVLMPSVDRVGRRFPLALMQPLNGTSPATFDHLTQDGTFEALETIALDALEDGMDRDLLERRLADVAVVASAPHHPLRRAGTALVLSDTSEKTIAAELAAGLMDGAGRMAQPSLWTALIDGARRAMICDGMPGPQEARALFDLNAPLWMDARPDP